MTTPHDHTTATATHRRGAYRLGAWRRFCHAQDGAVTIPALLFLPAFFMIMIASVELGVLMMKRTLIEHGVDIATRALRTGSQSLPDHDALKAAVCANMPFMNDCERDLTIEIFRIDPDNWEAALANPVKCTDRTVEDAPDVTLETGAINEMMMLRACLKVTPMTSVDPLARALATDAAGQFRMVTTTVFVNEPKASSATASSSSSTPAGS
ncbi:hypothetical protein [Paenirhodobacter sp. CAU 1674]|uniref:TadE/TadG family type IV pilus assembly protein n=1 Tax=Paenirhodobacter sp. CAU 1674 TaxID=3032596 RepID=UPI0023DC62F2|nr:hypothetical protein [Paenirhodobacter sp. CAU 1674]MDF2141589.1 hypothetical protein [Paenirhodobacter sp. CAU 1674]